jgi:transcriptional regulator with XRE-family HTH domain
VEETAQPLYFGEWLKGRRKQLDLTQSELARRAGCSVPALRKIEAGERRPSKQLAGLLAKSLEIPSEDQIIFIKVARGEQSVERLHLRGLGYRPALKIKSLLRVNLPVSPPR